MSFKGAAYRPPIHIWTGTSRMRIWFSSVLDRASSSDTTHFWVCTVCIWNRALKTDWTQTGRSVLQSRVSEQHSLVTCFVRLAFVPRRSATFITRRPACLLSPCAVFVHSRSDTTRHCSPFRKQVNWLVYQEGFLYSLWVHSCWLSTRSLQHPPRSWLQEWLLIKQQQGSTLWKGNFLAITCKMYFFFLFHYLEIWYWLEAGGCWRYEMKWIPIWRSVVSCALQRGWNQIIATGEKIYIDEYKKEKMFWGVHKESRKYFASYLISTFLMGEIRSSGGERERWERMNVDETVERLSGFWRGVWFVQKGEVSEQIRGGGGGG